MHGQKGNLRIFPECFLSPIAMMYVPIHDHDSIKTMFLHKFACCDRNMIDQAEPHRVFLHRMVPRWSYQTERITIVTCEHSFHRITRCT